MYVNSNKRILHNVESLQSYLIYNMQIEICLKMKNKLNFLKCFFQKIHI